MKKKLLCWFFAICDLWAIWSYFYWQIRYKRIPFYTDFVQEVSYQFNLIWFILFISIVQIILYASLFISVYWLIKQDDRINKLVFYQLPLRLFLILPSLPYVGYFFEILWFASRWWEVWAFVFGVLLSSEIFKIYLLKSAVKSDG